MHTYFRSAGIALCLTLSAVIAASASGPSPNTLDSVWIGTSEGILKVDAATGTIKQKSSSLSGATAFSVDERAAVIWAFSQGSLYQLSLDGTLLRTITVPNQGTGTGKASPQPNPSPDYEDHFCATSKQGLDSQTLGNFWPYVSLKIDPRDGTAWLSIGTGLYKAPPQGPATQVASLPEYITGIAIDAFRSRVWASQCHGVRAYDAQGNSVQQIQYSSSEPLVRDADFDADADVLWVLLNGTIRKHRGSGEQVFDQGLDGTGYKFLSADGAGGAWIAAGKQDSAALAKLDADGRTTATTYPFPIASKSTNEPIVSLTTNRRDWSAWTASATAIAKTSVSGTPQPAISLTTLGLSTKAYGLALGAYADTTAPDLSITAPADGAIVATPTPSFVLQYNDVGQGADPDTLSIEFNGHFIALACTHEDGKSSCQPLSTLADGPVAAKATIVDFAGNLSLPAEAAITIDTVPPTITVESPASGALTNQSALTLKALLSESASVTVNGASVALDPSNRLTFDTSLAEGTNTFTVSATDAAGNASITVVLVTLDTVAPSELTSEQITIDTADQDTVTVSGQDGAVEASARVRVTNARTGESVTVDASPSGAFAVSIAAAIGDELDVVMMDAAGNSGTANRIVVPSSSMLPPDPASVAPVLSKTGFDSFLDSTAFLYSGSNPIQTGVTPGVIEARRVAVLRGRVLDRSSHPTSGVTVGVKGHPEYGSTLSRADGNFDLAVNGGGALTVTFDKLGLLPAQRQVDTPWQDFVAVPDVAMVALDSNVSFVDLTATAPIQVAQGNPVTDSDGTRQATVLFPQGVTASMRLPDGSTQPLSSMHVRATEYTVGPNGPKAMPGSLPATSTYTYAVELSVDEAMAAGAKEVSFSKPLPVYVDNFTNFPVGHSVPTGYYDRDRALWTPIVDGRVVKVLSVSDGMADLDVTGSGTASDATARSALGITDAERTQVATLYPVGKSLWRVLITHFTPYDLNHPLFVPDDDAVAPTGLDSNGHGVETEQEREKDCSKKCGSIIEVENQILGERISISGTPFSLNYRSDRVKGYLGTHRIRVPLSASTIPGILKRIDVAIEIGGRKVVEKSFPAATNQTFLFDWDGKDAYGREVAGGIGAAASISYVYDGKYGTLAVSPADREARFARFPTSATYKPSGARWEYLLTTRKEVWLRATQSVAAAQGLGAWTLDVNHMYDFAAGGTLLLGNGSSRYATGLYMSSAAPGIYISGVAVDQSGSAYVSGNGYGLRKISTDGTISAITPNYAFLALAADPQGDAFYTVYTFFNKLEIDRVTTAGQITRIAGSVFGSLSGPRVGPALQAVIRPRSLAVDRDGSIYFTETDTVKNGFFAESCYVKKLSLDGIISIVAGDDLCSGQYGGDDGAAVNAHLVKPRSLAVDSQGNLYIADSEVVRKITRDGIIRTVAGDKSGTVCATQGNTADGALAVGACLGAVQSVAVDKLDRLIIASSGWGPSTRIRTVRGGGLLATLAGPGATSCNQANGVSISQVGPAQGFCLNDVFTATTVNANGDILSALGTNLAITSSRQTRWVGLKANGVSTIESSIPSHDGNLVVVYDGSVAHMFNLVGKHDRTVDATTNTVLYGFGYDALGHLLSIQDGDGNLTTITRDGAGNPIAITAPDGQRTEFGMDSHGFLASVTNPADETYQMAYSDDGLLLNFQSPKGPASHFSYDAFGRLTHDQNAAGGYWHLDRTRLPENTYEVQVSSALGYTTRYSVATPASGGKVRTVTQPNGLKSQSVIAAGGTTTSTAPDGTVTTSVEGPDPRFGMQAPLETSASVKLTSGLMSTRSMARQVTLQNATDPLSLTSLTDTFKSNGRQSTLNFNATTRRWTSTSPVARKTIADIDTQGRVLTTQLADLAVTSRAYDTRGRLSGLTQGSGIDARSWSFDYYGADDATQAGFLESITDPLARTVNFEYDAAGRMTAQTLPGARRIAYTYDANGNLTSLQPPGRDVHVFEYDSVDQVDNDQPPELPEGSTVTQYHYNLDKQLTSVERPDGQTLNFDYDAGGRLQLLTTPDGSISYGYHPTTGHLATISAAGGPTLSYTYDGFLPLTETWSGAVSGSVGRSYDSNFWLKTLSVNGSAISYSYDNDGLLTQAGDLALTPDPMHGMLRATTLGKVTTALDYNTFGELTQHSAKVDGATLYSTAYVTDAIGRITSKTETIQGGSATTGYEYDSAGRLSMVKVNGSQTAAYAYDANGNRMDYNGTVGTYDAQDRLLTYGTASYSYTENGELLSKSQSGATTRYQYDLLGNLRKVTLPGDIVINYVVDGRNRRVGKQVNGTLVQGFLYQDQVKPVAELDGGGNVVARFVYADKRNVPSYLIKGGQTYRIVSDYLGSPRLIINTVTGAIAQRLDYDEFGNLTADTNPGFQPFGFAGGLYDLHTGLVRFGARDYDPVTGRWTAKDPIGFAGGDSNVYSYVGGNPISYIDPMGLDSHHVFPRQNWPGYSNDAQGVFDKGEWSRVPTAGRHGWSTLHKDYNQATKEVAEKFCKSRGIDPSKMSELEAEDLLNEIRESREPTIRDFLEREAGPSKLPDSEAPPFSRSPALLAIYAIFHSEPAY